MIHKIQKLLMALKKSRLKEATKSHEETMLLALLMLKKIDEVPESMTVGEFGRRVIVDFIFEVNDMGDL